MSSKKISKICKLLPMLCMAGALFTPMMSQAAVCPAAGSALDCNVLFTIGSGNAITTTFPDPNAYDGIEDMLVGVSNLSGGSIASLTLSGTNIFGFDGDGVATYTSNYYDGTGYAGPNTSFNIVDNDNGTVFFSGGLADGASAYFSLEYPASAFAQGGGGSVGVSPVPEPETYAMLLAGLGLIGFTARRRSKSIQSSSPNAGHDVFSRMATVALTLCLGLAAGAANAIPVMSGWSGSASTGYSAIFSNNDVNNTFTDSFNFSLPADASGNGASNVISLGGSGVIFTTFSLFESSIGLISGGTGGTTSSLSFSNGAVPGNYALTVNGYKIDPNLTGSYAGNVAVSPVPEPKTYATLLLGLGLIGFSARRRNNV
jgi:hypothetical protein